MNNQTGKDQTRTPNGNAIGEAAIRRLMITHQHASVPFDVNGGKASLDLKP